MEWRISKQLVEYPEAVAAMERRVGEIIAGEAEELVWLLEHPPLYTAGTSAKAGDLLDSARFPAYETGRGGEYTYHGPGQRIAYVMLDLNPVSRHPEQSEVSPAARDPSACGLRITRVADLRRYVHDLERCAIATLARFGVKGETREGRIGIWVPGLAGMPGGEAKIAAIGIRVRKWVTYHGLALNVNPDLSHFAGIVPCGIKNYGVTSLEQLGLRVTMEEVDEALKQEFGRIFGMS